MSGHDEGELADDRAQREEVEDDCAGTIAALQERVGQLERERGGSLDREFLGQLVRAAWVDWAKTQPDDKPGWLLEWAQLDERMKEADRQIGEKVASMLISPFTLIAEHETEKVEQLLVLMTDRFFQQTDLVGPGDLCQECKQAHRCGPDGDEPCKEFEEARERFTDLAPVREHLDEMTRAGRRWPTQDDLEVRVAVCLWCGYQETYHPGTPKAEARARMREHDKVCPKSPIVARALAAEKDLLRVTADWRLLLNERNGDVWTWQGDSEDHLESLTCPVLIGAADLRELLAGSPYIDWDAAKAHFDEVLEIYKGLPPESGAPAIRLTFRPLLARYEGGERSQLLFDEMMR